MGLPVQLGHGVNLEHLIKPHGLRAGERSFPKETRVPLSEEGGLDARQVRATDVHDGMGGSTSLHTQEGEFMGIDD